MLDTSIAGQTIAATIGGKLRVLIADGANVHKVLWRSRDGELTGSMDIDRWFHERRSQFEQPERKGEE